MMIYTCTMNLAIDLFIKTAQMLPSEVNRTDGLFTCQMERRKRQLHLQRNSELIAPPLVLKRFYWPIYRGRTAKGRYQTQFVGGRNYSHQCVPASRGHKRRIQTRQPRPS